jgi:type II secretory pathway component PulK
MCFVGMAEIPVVVALPLMAKSISAVIRMFFVGIAENKKKGHVSMPSID